MMQGLIVTLEGIDVWRALVLGGIAWCTGSTFSALVLFVGRYRREPSRLWLARCALRVSTLCLLFFVTDTLLQSWNDPLRARTIVVLFGVIALDWALDVVTHDVLRTPGRHERRSGDVGA